MALGFLLVSLPSPLAYALAIPFILVLLGHWVLDLLRNYRDFRNDK